MIQPMLTVPITPKLTSYSGNLEPFQQPFPICGNVSTFFERVFLLDTIYNKNFLPRPNKCKICF